MNDAIEFHSHQDAWGYFSNFSNHAIYLEGKIWPTVEHYYQAQKFAGTEHEEWLRKAPSSEDAAMWGRDINRPIKENWDDVKEEVMRNALYAKFTQHPDLKNHLLRTKKAEIVEATPKNTFWGTGPDGNGLNTFGRLIMETRQRICDEESIT